MSISIKNKFLYYVNNQMYPEIVEQIISKSSNLRYLYRLLYNQDELTRWRAIESMGIVQIGLRELNLMQFAILSGLWALVRCMVDLIKAMFVYIIS